MANQNTAFGLKPIQDAYSGPYSGGARTYVHDSGDSTAIYIGDLVTATGAASTVNGETMANVIQSSTGDVFTGVVVGVLPVTRDSLPYCAASTTRTLLVEDNPNALFEIQEVSGGTQLTANDIGLNANVLVAAGSTVTGLSGTMLNNVGIATTNTLDVKVIGLVNRADNAVGAYAKWVVRINRHRYANQVAGV